MGIRQFIIIFTFVYVWTFPIITIKNRKEEGKKAKTLS